MALKLSTALKRQMLSSIAGSVTDAASLKAGVVKIYSGSQPATADGAATGTLLLQATVSSGASTPGSATNGIDYEFSGVSLVKSTNEVWSGTGLSAGTAGWFRICGNATDDGSESTTLPRIDGRISTSGAEMSLSNLNIVVGAATTIDSWSLAFPSTL